MLAALTQISLAEILVITLIAGLFLLPFALVAAILIVLLKWSRRDQQRLIDG